MADEVVEKSLQILLPQLGGMTLVVKEDIAANPEYIGLFGTGAELDPPTGQTDPFKKVWFLLRLVRVTP